MNMQDHTNIKQKKEQCCFKELARKQFEYNQNNVRYALILSKKKTKKTGNYENEEPDRHLKTVTILKIRATFYICYRRLFP